MIEKITDQNLERYDSRLKEWCDRKFFEKGNYGKYQTTEEAGAVAFYPAPDTPLEGKVKFSFKETMPTEGTKGPDNPSTITGVSNITVTHCESEGVDSTNYTISFGNTYYGGEIDLATGVMTIICQKVLIDENCSYTLLANETNEDRVAVVVTIPDFLSSDEFKLLRSTSSCDSFPLVQYQNITNSDECIMFGGQWQAVRYKQLRVYMLRSTLGVSSSATATEVQEAAKTWFTSHPATFIAGYEEPFWTTIYLTPIQIFALTQRNKYTPRLNTVYTDADSVQISYLKSPIRDEYEKTQAILSLGGNS